MIHQGTLLVKSKTTMNENGYPLDIDISADGQKLAVSYLTMDNKDVKPILCFTISPLSDRVRRIIR